MSIVIFTNKPSERHHYRRICFHEDPDTKSTSDNSLCGEVVLTCNTVGSKDEYSEYKMKFIITSNLKDKTGDITFINSTTQISYVMKYKISDEPFALELSRWCESDVPKYKVGAERIIFGEDPFKTMNLVTTEDIKITNFYRDEHVYKPFKLLTSKEQDYIKEQRKKQQQRSGKITQLPPPPAPSIMTQTQREYNKQPDMRSYIANDSSWWN